MKQVGVGSGGQTSPACSVARRPASQVCGPTRRAILHEAQSAHSEAGGL
jgi:hypothetical protein